MQTFFSHFNVRITAKVILTFSFFIILCISVYSSAAFAQRPPFPNYEVEYTVKYHGITIGESTRRFHLDKKGAYRVDTKIESNFPFIDIEINENSAGHWKNGKFIPEAYEYEYRNKSTKRHTKLTFDWKRKKIIDLLSNTRWKPRLKSNTQDKLSAQLSLQASLYRDKPEYTFQVADDGAIEDYHFKLLGVEWVDTPYGNLETLKIQHESTSGRHVTTFWVAPSLNYILVRLRQTEDGSEVALVKLESLAID